MMNKKTAILALIFAAFSIVGCGKKNAAVGAQDASVEEQPAIEAKIVYACDYQTTVVYQGYNQWTHQHYYSQTDIYSCLSSDNESCSVQKESSGVSTTCEHPELIDSDLLVK